MNYKYVPTNVLTFLLKPPGAFAPTIPLKPAKPEYYENKYNYGLKSPVTSTNDFEFADWGGWGSLTFGLLTPSDGDHSYGVLG